MVDEEENSHSWFSMGMIRSEKIEARKPWHYNLIIKLLGRRIGYHYLSKRIQAMWKPQLAFTLIDLTKDIFIVKFTSKDDHNKALLNGPWMIRDHYLHVQCWKPNFMADTEVINLLPVWFRFLVLPIEYYITQWLHRVGNKIKRTLKVNDTTMFASRGKFVHVCFEIDISKPLKAGYTLRGLYTLSIECDRYGHTITACPEKLETGRGSSTNSQHQEAPTIENESLPLHLDGQENQSSFGGWMIAQRARRRPARVSPMSSNDSPNE